MTGKALRRAALVVLAFAVGIVTFARCNADNGDAIADLRLAHSLSEQTATAGGFQTGQATDDGIEWCNWGDFNPHSGGQASLKFPLDLKGQRPEDVLSRVSAFWRQSGHDILDSSVSVDDNRTDSGVLWRVHMYGGGWNAAVEESLGQKGTYELTASGPCTVNTKGSIGAVATNPPSPSTHRCLDNSESFRGDIDGDGVPDTGDVCLTGRDQVQVIVNGSRCGTMSSDVVSGFDPHGIYGTVDNGDGTRLVLVNAYNASPEGPNLDIFSLVGCSLRSVRDASGPVPGQFVLNLVNAKYQRNAVVCERADGHLRLVLRKSDRAGEGRWQTLTSRWIVANGKASHVDSVDGPTVDEKDLAQPDHSLDCEGVRSPL